MKPISFHPEAKLEAEDGTAYYYERNPQAADDFMTVLAEITSSIQASPERWPFHLKSTVQRRYLRCYPYTIFYANEPDRIFIVAIAHTSRRPGYWKKRISS